MSSTSEAIRRWQAESLAKRLLEDDDISTVLANAFDLKCQAEFEEAISTLAQSKERAIGRTCAEGFADFSMQVDLALENTGKTVKARESLIATEQVLNEKLSSRARALANLNEAEGQLNQAHEKIREVEMCLKWLERKRAIETLIYKKEYVVALKQSQILSEELRQYSESTFATRLRKEVLALDVQQLAEQELYAWMTTALDKGREIGFNILSNENENKRKRSTLDLDSGPVDRFFAIARRDYAEDRYVVNRLPALQQTLSSLSRATAALSPEERLVRFRNVLAEVCGFFVIEREVNALSQGEIKQTWKDCQEKLILVLEDSFPLSKKTSTLNDDQGLASVGIDFARTCFEIGMDYNALQAFFVSRRDPLTRGWLARSRSAVEDFCAAQLGKSTRSSDDSVQYFTQKTQQEIARASKDAKVLEAFLQNQFISSSGKQSAQAILESQVVEPILAGVLQKSKCDLNDALFVFRTARELRLSSETPSAFSETETKAREKIQELFVATKVDETIIFRSPGDYLPTLSASTKVEPHVCVLKALQEIDTAFSSQEAAALPREVRASLQQETVGRLAERMDKCIFKDAPLLNPLSLKVFYLDLLAIDQAFPEYFDRFAPMLNALAPFVSEGTLEPAVRDLIGQDSAGSTKEQMLSLLLRFREMDASSRLFAPPALKKNIVDIRESEARRLLALLQGQVH